MESSDLRMLALLHTGSHCQWDFANTARRESLRGNAHDGSRPLQIDKRGEGLFPDAEVRALALSVSNQICIKGMHAQRRTIADQNQSSSRPCHGHIRASQVF